MAVIVDYYDVATGGGYTLYSGNYTKVSQSFTVGGEGTLNSCKFKLMKYGTTGLPTGNAVVKIYTHSGIYGTSSVPTGSALATSDNFDVSTLTTTATWTTFTFSSTNKITLTAEEYYCVALEYSGGDVDNSIFAGLKTVSYTHSGNSAYYIDSWTAQAYDLVFYVYKDGGVFPLPTYFQP